MKRIACGLVLAVFAGAASAGDLTEPRYESGVYPAQLMFQVRFGEQGVTQLALNGVDLRGARLSSSAAEGGGFFGTVTGAEWIGVGIAAVIFGVIAVELVDNLDTGGGGGDGTGGS